MTVCVDHQVGVDGCWVPELQILVIVAKIGALFFKGIRNSYQIYIIC